MFSRWTTSLVESLAARRRPRDQATLPHAAAPDHTSGPSHGRPLETDHPRRKAEVARQLCETLDRAVELGLWEHANRVAQTAMRLAQQYPNLSERLARLRLAQDDPESALTIIDSCAVGQARWNSLRLLRAVCLIQLGRRLEAHLDLREWAHRAAVPLQARVLLALLEWQSGDADAAITALRQNLGQLEDPRTLTALLLISICQHRHEQAAMWAHRLQQAATIPHDEAASLDLLLRSIGLHSWGDQVSPSLDAARNLAIELAADETIIPTLIEAQLRRPHVPTARLLYTAIEHALPELDDQSAGCEALAKLALVLEDRDAAQQWAARGVELAPLSASLQRLACELAGSAADRQGQRDPDVLATIGTAGEQKERAA